MTAERTGKTRVTVLAVAFALALPIPALAAGGSGGATPPGGESYVTGEAAQLETSGEIGGVEIFPLINSGETAFGTLFEGLPDGIGVVPAPAPLGYVDLYVNHEQSRVPFRNEADFQDSSVSRVRLDTSTLEIIAMDVALSPDEGFIRFCSSFMAGPEHGFPQYTLITNEESNDPLAVPDGAVYGSDPAYGGLNVRQAGFAVTLDTATGKVTAVAGSGRHNHENTVIVPGGWDGIFSMSGDDTFTFPSSSARPNLSQMYAFGSTNWKAFQKDEGTMWAFRVTGTQDGAVDADDPFNGANDYFDIELGDTFTGEFITVDEDVARGDTASLPQDALEDWSNASNVFQFIRVEDVAYDPDNPRVVYFADTGNTSLYQDPATGRLYRSSSLGTLSSAGRIFKMVLNEDDPTIVDEFSIVVEAGDIGMRSPDNLDVGHDSMMVQEDTSSYSKIWMYDLDDTWTHVATSVPEDAETSGIVDMSGWLGDGWWALDVQNHGVDVYSETGHVYTHPVSGAQSTYKAKREDGQLLLMYVPGS